MSGEFAESDCVTNLTCVVEELIAKSTVTESSAEAVNTLPCRILKSGCDTPNALGCKRLGNVAIKFDKYEAASPTVTFVDSEDRMPASYLTPQTSRE